MPKKRFLTSDQGYDLVSTVYDKKESYLNSFEKGRLLPLLGNISGQHILDVGAGTGRVTLPLTQKGAIVTALDVSEGMLERLRIKAKRLPITTVQGDAETLPFSDETFDMVVAAFLIVHLKDPRRFFDEAYRVLKDGGKLVVTNINQKEPPEIETKEGNIVIESYYHRPERIIEILEDLAFTIEENMLVMEGHVWVNQILVAKK